MKRTLNTIAAIAIVGSVVVSSVTHAEETKPRTDGTANTGMTAAPAPRDESAYWAQKKLEAQQKSTEMRRQRVQELQARGVDTSSITPDLLDGTKTEEKLFWDAMKLIMQSQDATNRQKVADELKKAGYDTSSLTSDILDPTKSDEPKFWNAVKAIREPKNTSGATTRPADTGTRSKDDNMRPNENGTVRTPNNRPSGDVKGGEKRDESKPGMGTDRPKPQESGMDRPKPQDGNMERPPQANNNGANTSGNEMQKPAQKPVLTEKMRQNLVKKFNAVSDEKKAAYYAKTKANLEAQLEKTKTNKNNRLARKITETLAILDYVLGSVDDAADDDIINSATAE